MGPIGPLNTASKAPPRAPPRIITAANERFPTQSGEELLRCDLKLLFALPNLGCKMAAAGSDVAFMSSSSSKVAEELRMETVKEIRSHEVAIAELNHLSSSRSVYQKNGNLFFRTSIQKATASEQKQLDTAKAKLQKLNPS